MEIITKQKGNNPQSHNAGMSRASKKRRREPTTSSVKLCEIGDTRNAMMKTNQEKKVNLQDMIRKEIEMELKTTSSLTIPTSLKEILDLEDTKDISCTDRAAQILSILLSPTDRTKFYVEHWERLPLHNNKHSETNKKSMLHGIISKKVFKDVLKTHSLVYNVDVETSLEIPSSTSVKNRDATDSYTAEEVKEDSLWTVFRGGSTIRLLCPQKYIDYIWALLSSLEFEFNSRVGCYIDLIPPVTSKINNGFKPKFNSFDSLIVQVEGHSRWRLYTNVTGWELPRCSSNDIEIAELETKTCVIDVILKPNDTLYIPKGWIYRHENCSPNEENALILWIQMNEATAMADLMESIIPEALSESIESNIEMRRSLPRSLTSFMGVASSENEEDVMRKMFLGITTNLLKDVTKKAMDMIDAAADQVGFITCHNM